MYYIFICKLRLYVILKNMLEFGQALFTPLTLSASKSLMAVPRNTPPGRRTHLIEAAHLCQKLRSWSINCTK